MYSSGLTELIKQMEKSLYSAKENEAKGTVRADVFLVEEQASVARVRNFSLFSDEPESSGGKDLGPTPLEFFLASIGFCENVTFVRTAALMGVKFDKLNTRIVGHWNRKGQFEINGQSPSFTEIMIEFLVSSTDNPQKLVEVARTTTRRCPLHATLSKATNIHVKLNINGQEVSL
jgi:putative redox protein